MKIVALDNMYFHASHQKVLKSLGSFIQYTSNPQNEEQAIQRAKDAEIIINFWLKMPASMFTKLPKLRYVCVAAVGYEWIDIEAARKQNIIVSNCPGHNAESVAEHTIGLMIDASRLSTQAQIDLRMGLWKSTHYIGFDLTGKTLGIIGFGRIGKRVAEIAQNGLRMKIISINSKNSRKDLESLLKRSDIISINAPLNDQTRGLISDKEFRLMKKDVVLINTGRGAIINEKALITNLSSGKIFAAGLDTFTHEPIEKNNPLFQFPNVTLTPHIAWNTSETEYRLSKIVVDNVRSFIHGKPINVVS